MRIKRLLGIYCRILEKGKKSPNRETHVKMFIAEFHCGDRKLESPSLGQGAIEYYAAVREVKSRGIWMEI